MKVKSRESRVESQRLLRAALIAAVAALVAMRSHAQCHIDPISGQRVCTLMPQSGVGAPALDPRLSTLDASAHCRITVGDGSTGSGTLVRRSNSLGLVLTCSHLFDNATGRIIVSFTNGQRFAARLVERDRAHDLAALMIRRPDAEPITASDNEPDGILSACGYGPDGQLRCFRGNITGQATAVGAVFPSLTIGGAARPGDSGGGVLNANGQLVGVLWGQRDGLTYATCGQPVREFLRRILRQPANQPPAQPGKQAAAAGRDWQAWSAEIESRLQSIHAQKQDKGDYVQRGDLKDYLRTADAPKLDGQLDSLAARFRTVHSRVESIEQRVKQVVAGKAGYFEGLSFGKLLVGALGLSGPVAAAVVIAGGLAGRRVRSRLTRRESKAAHLPALHPRPSTLDPRPIPVDSPPPPQRTVPETHYVPVEKDSFAKAHQWASEQVARKYPGATEVLQAQDSLIKQHLAAQ
jgi:Trypsin-like peptidase domain